MNPSSAASGLLLGAVTPLVRIAKRQLRHIAGGGGSPLTEFEARALLEYIEGLERRL